jgi:hypothetical protein
MPRRRSAPEIEVAAAASTPRPTAPGLHGGEAIAMLVRRGLTPRLARRDVPFPRDLDEASADAIAERLRHYSFRLFLRGAILAKAPFDPATVTRYVTAERARAIADDLVALGLASAPSPGRYRLRYPARNFGGTLEWWVGRELRRTLGFDVATGVRSGAPGVGGDLDVVAAAEGKLVYVELKSSPPKHLTDVEVDAFFRRVRSLRPHTAIFAVDTALRLSDKVLPLFATVLGRGAEPPPRPERILRDTWRIAGSVYLTSARQDLIENLRAAIADAFKVLGPPAP